MAMKRLADLTPLMVFGIRIFMVALLMMGSFMGFANDPALSGMYWMFTMIWVVMEAAI